MGVVSAEPAESAFIYRVIRYTPNLVRDEWVNIGVLVFHRDNGELRLRLIEGQDEYNRVRRLHPDADETLLRAVQEDLETRFETAREIVREARAQVSAQEAVANWDRTLSNALQLAAPKGVLGYNLDEEVERLYRDHVALQRAGSRVGLPGSRSSIRSYCGQVFRQAHIWDRLDKAVRIAEYTFPGDPMRIDFGYRRNGTRGFVHALSATRSPGDAKALAYTAKRIQEKARFASEFTAVTDIALRNENERHGFISDTLRDAGIEPVPMEAFATWVPKLRERLQQERN